VTLPVEGGARVVAAREWQGERRRERA